MGAPDSAPLDGQRTPILMVQLRFFQESALIFQHLPPVVECES
jgi:hypothetical protein